MKILTLDEINSLQEKGRENLTQQELDQIYHSILSNPKAIEIAQNGAIAREDWNTLFFLMQLNNPNKWFERGESDKSISND